jgi:hypothetical protein
MPTLLLKDGTISTTTSNAGRVPNLPTGALRGPEEEMKVALADKGISFRPHEDRSGHFVDLTMLDREGRIVQGYAKVAGDNMYVTLTPGVGADSRSMLAEALGNTNTSPDKG